MGNCNGLPSPDNQPTTTSATATAIATPPPKNTLNVLPASSPPPPRPPPIIGRVLGRPLEDVRATYTFHRELGRGQFGVTYLVTHKATRQSYACKSIATRKLITRDDVEDVRREVQIMHHLTGNRNIVELKGALEDRHSVNLVMEVCEGVALGGEGGSNARRKNWGRALGGGILKW